MFTSVVMHAVIHDADYDFMHGLNNLLKIWGLGGNYTLYVEISIQCRLYSPAVFVRTKLFSALHKLKGCKALSLSGKNIFADVPLAQKKFDFIIDKKYSGQHIHQGQFTISDKLLWYHLQS